MVGTGICALQGRQPSRIFRQAADAQAMRFVDIPKLWRKIGPIYRRPEVTKSRYQPSIKENMSTQAKDERVISLKLATLGAVAGAVSWAVVPVVSGKFEPFDSTVGMLANQMALTIPVVIVALRYRLFAAFLFGIGAYIGLNAYVFALGGTEHKAWWVLGAVVSTVLFAAPLVAAFSAVAMRKLHQATK